ncbi:serum response factor homolog A-like [Anopheles moucheti]|uniref:serum response factor homolog A-like n=1 Tax=Anopheles moucheti TaxID=186751 RepID=UPI0022F03CA7|nr:serum response factor homolog A-like [Anopheles moucheti]
MQASAPPASQGSARTKRSRQQRSRRQKQKQQQRQEGTIYRPPQMRLQQLTQPQGQQMQQKQQQQPQRQLYASVAATVPLQQAGGTWSVVGPRKQPRTSVQQQQPRSQQQQRVRRMKSGVIEVVPQAGKTWVEVYTKVRRALNQDESMRDIAQHVKMGKRTRVNNLRLPLSRSADTEGIRTKIQELLGEEATMSDLIVSHIDPSATEQELRDALDAAIEGKAGITTLSMWERFDGVKTARVRLPAKQVKALSGRSIKLCGCISYLDEAMPAPVERQRCYRCLLLGHLARDCR